MAHPEYRKNITKKELNSRQYVSIVDELRRHIRIHHKIKVSYFDKYFLFTDLITILRDLYNVPNKDFSKIGSTFMIQKYSYKIISYKPGKIFEIETLSKGQLYNIKYVIKKSFKNFYLHYYDYSKTQKTMQSLTTNVAKYFYKREVKKNAKLLKRKLKILQKERGKR